MRYNVDTLSNVLQLNVYSTVRQNERGGAPRHVWHSIHITDGPCADDSKRTLYRCRTRLALCHDCCCTRTHTRRDVRYLWSIARRLANPQCPRGSACIAAVHFERQRAAGFLPRPQFPRDAPCLKWCSCCSLASHMLRVSRVWDAQRHAGTPAASTASRRCASTWVGRCSGSGPSGGTERRRLPVAAAVSRAGVGLSTGCCCPDNHCAGSRSSSLATC